MFHSNHYVETAIGVHYKFMTLKSFMSVSAAILANCAKNSEDSSYWFNKACDDGIVFW